MGVNIGQVKNIREVAVWVQGSPVLGKRPTVAMLCAYCLCERGGRGWRWAITLKAKPSNSVSRAGDNGSKVGKYLVGWLVGR